MIATPIPVTLILPPSPTPRSKGVHVSSIIRCIATDMGILKPEWVDEPTLADVRVISDPVAITRICIGLAWEEWYIPQILAAQGVEKHPGEMFKDEIYMSPDGLQAGGVLTLSKGSVRTPPVIHEVKATYKSINTVGDLKQQWLWLTQIKAYCKGAGTRYARLHVLFICGDYKWPLQPSARAWDLEFTQKEIDSNWELITDYRDYKEGQ